MLGVDLATAAARVHAVDPADGTVLAEAARPLPAPRTPRPGWVEQDPQYADAARGALAEVCAALGARAADVAALSVTGTSGTVLAADADGRPTGPALLYSDDRGRDLVPAGTGASAGRLLWLAAHTPGARYLHTPDVVVADLTGVLVTDTSHALKAGTDPAARRWPQPLADRLGAALPDLVHPGTPVGTVRDAVAAELGLPRGVVVVAGMTDGCTAQIAAGAVAPGQTIGVLGTTLVLKGVAAAEVDRDGVYSHLAPDGSWWPGGASNTGAGTLTATADLAALDTEALAAGPSPLTCYPLPPPPRQGERFPFRDEQVQAFLVGPGADRAGPVQRHRAELDGVAFTERLGLELLAGLGVASTDHRAVGGGSRSLPWLTVRASTLGRPVSRPATPHSGFGAALLAATALEAGGPAALPEVTARAVHPDVVVDPDPAQVEGLAAGYRRLLDELGRRGLLEHRPLPTPAVPA
ncbi:Sugar (pentulose or hexulose) kinase [Klenkia brasiliensis]|uniref:Sugar (Pentulose or hexulose) kinase n=1 Tax=Klenkia brasiliensis TaxID=333142 RepID=A0A1G7UVH9_9ACTN|nr:Sugar (pentulose or hexulose) kinase [Klenkia brasiliensis]